LSKSSQIVTLQRKKRFVESRNEPAVPVALLNKRLADADLCNIDMLV